MVLDPALTRRLLLGHGCGAALLVPATALAGKRQVSPRARPQAPVVVLDPGHGGKDPGAIGVSGTYEKHIAFATADALAARLTASGRYRVHVTRGRDEFIPLADRVAFAQAHGAALFVSLHADAIADPGVRGASVYTLAEHASDAQSAALADRENAADRYAPPGRRESPLVEKILASLVRQETRLGSADLQHHVVGSLARAVPMLPNPARHAGFAVLKAADIPSVLIEIGFMSNPTDEAALRRPAHRATVVAAIQGALDAYFASEGRLVTIPG